VINTKKCTRCKSVLPQSDFYKDKKKRDGLTSWCIKCCSESNRTSYCKNAENRNKHSAEYRINNIEKDRERHKKYDMTHREWRNKIARRWQINHPDVIAIFNANRRARVLHAPGDGITRQQRHEIMESYGNRCAYCGNADRLQIDHIVPLSKGGAHSVDNAVPACCHCNTSKSDDSLLIFMQKRVIYG
jgi:5-methylcytosine-specific restriction endonuclease McrA